MIWKDYLKLSEIASYSKFAWATKAPPPPSPMQNIVNIFKTPIQNLLPYTGPFLSSVWFYFLHIIRIVSKEFLIRFVFIWN